MGPSILLVDDDADIRMSVRQLLVHEGFTVHTANDGQQALRVLEKIEPPALILLDYKMPVMDGKRFLAAMRERIEWRQIPVVLLSSWTREWSGAHLEVADVLNKPVDPDVLLNTVTALVLQS